MTRPADGAFTGRQGHRCRQPPARPGQAQRRRRGRRRARDVQARLRRRRLRRRHRQVRDTGVPHFVALQQVAEGTTTDQVLEYFQSGEEAPPSFGLPGSFETGSISPGRSLTADYDLPPGQYVVLCFFPDPKMDGVPHAFMGMLEMIHLT